MRNPSLDLKTSYDRLTIEYVRRFYHELDHKPQDRELLDRFAEEVKDLGPVCDLGCGPGHIARYLKDRGVDSFGIDLSPGMVAAARRLNSGIEFYQGDMLALTAEDASWGGIVALYSIIHIDHDKVPRALQEMKRVLKPGGLLLISFHIGDETLHLDELWGEQVSLDFIFFTIAGMQDYLQDAGFGIRESLERAPYEEVEYPSQRAYILAQKPVLQVSHN
ncbi:MAG: class I SAM-dependent methyltransferase [Fidelibacterota bacterium]|nr:MAG: class I SAM-dependent methyltransferase [Candidatus Neomarinimicrobiota bacterium]